MRQMWYFICLWLSFGCFLVQSLSVDPKLEFIDENKKDNTAPKIQGVRVIVDTSKINSKLGDAENISEEKTETIKINTSGPGKQTVGIRTDITFEIADDKNGTKAEGRDADSDDSDHVPIIRSDREGQGQGTVYADQGQGDGRTSGNVDFNANPPIYHRTDDENYNGAGGTWVSFFPVSSTWTTERSFLTRQNDGNLNTGFIPYTVNDRSYKPCVCANDQPTWKGNGINRRSFVPQPQARRLTRVDDKLEYPFSNSEKRKRK